MGRALVILAVFVCSVARVSAAQEKLTERDKAVDESIKKALRYLKRTQTREGWWTVGERPNAAVTGLAVMAFLSAGHVPGEGPYAETVEKGIKAVLRAQQANGLIAVGYGHEVYHHGICTLMLAEVAGMTRGNLTTEVKKKLEKAVTVVLRAQRKNNSSHDGGWRYRVIGSDSDLSV